MSNVAIRAENLGKKYTIGHQSERERYTALRDVVMKNARGLWHKTRDLVQGKPMIHGDTHEDFWALQDVNFEIRQGEAVGIIGRNGAGKSTLLKILSRITEPSTGRLTIKGRVASLLEVGTGFHPELSGRENIYLNGAILGMTRREIKRKFDEIIAFAEVDKYLDTPVKRYSSGMYVRLAFAVAAHLEPEILVVDEVLAVGDAEFQKKCLGKMEDVAGEGRTVLFVSHNMGAIVRLCSRSIVLSQGMAVYEGESDEAVKRYLMSGATLDLGRRVTFADASNLPIVIHEVAVTAVNKADGIPLDVTDQLEVEIHYSVKQDMKKTNLSFALKRDGVVLSRSWDIDADYATFELRKAGNYLSRIILPRGIFLPGYYSILIAAGQPGIGALIVHDDCITFEVHDSANDNSNNSSSRKGMLNLPISWQTSLITKEQHSSFNSDSLGK